MTRSSQSTVCRTVNEISRIFASNLRNFVKFPEELRLIRINQQKFYEIAQFPGVVGCIDGTHITIENPGGPNAEVYRNRKGRFSINVQVQP